MTMKAKKERKEKDLMDLEHIVKFILSSCKNTIEQDEKFKSIMGQKSTK